MPQSSYCSPGRPNAKNSCIEMSKKSLCSLPTVALPPSRHSPAWLGENPQHIPSTSGRKKAERNMHAAFQLWRRLPGGRVAVWPDEGRGQTQHTLGPWAPLRMEESSVTSSSTREPTAPQTPEGGRGPELLRNKLVTLSNWKITERRCTPVRVWGIPRVSS